MNADALVDLLLELNIINPQDVDREISKLAARVLDPRGQKWFRRVPRFFLLNIDRLASEPYVAKAEPRGIRASKYYHEPFPRSDVLRPAWRGDQPPPQTPKQWGEKPFAGDASVCPTCGGKGKLKLVGAWWTPIEPEYDTDAEKKTYRTCQRCKGTGKNKYEVSKGREGFFLGADVAEAYDPKTQTYTTALHEPVIRRDIEGNFTPFKPKKAKTKSLPGEAPSKSQLDPWMTGASAADKEFHHFDPIQVKRRDLYSRLENLVNFLNWQSAITRKQNPTDQERAQADSAEMLFRRLETMKTDDIHGFRDLMLKGQEFRKDFEDKPWLFSNDGKEIAVHGHLTLRKATSAKTAVALTKRPDTDNNEPGWCTDSFGTAEGYLKQGPLYFIEKNGRSYVLCHFESSQVRASKNGSQPALTPDQVKEIAPLFVSRPVEFSDAILRRGNAELANAVAALRRKTPVRKN